MQFSYLTRRSELECSRDVETRPNVLIKTRPKIEKLKICYLITVKFQNLQFVKYFHKCPNTFVSECIHILHACSSFLVSSSCSSTFYLSATSVQVIRISELFGKSIERIDVDRDESDVTDFLGACKNHFLYSRSVIVEP